MQRQWDKLQVLVRLRCTGFRAAVEEGKSVQVPYENPCRFKISVVKQVILTLEDISYNKQMIVNDLESQK